MKIHKYYVFIVFFFSITLKAQEDKTMSVGLSPVYYKLEKMSSFYGVLLDLSAPRPTQLFDKIFIRPGFKTGLLYSRLEESGNEPLNLGPFLQSTSLNYNVKGNMFLFPAGFYVLLGASEDFFELGLDLQLLQSYSTFQFDMENIRSTYQQNSYSFLSSFSLGYRHQPLDNGIVFKVLWKPTADLTNDDKYLNSYLISIGYVF